MTEKTKIEIVSKAEEKAGELSKPLHLKFSHIMAAFQCAAIEVQRYYLRGVYIEVRNQIVKYTATDGHILLTCNHDLDIDRCGHDTKAAFILANEDILKLQKFAAKATKNTGSIDNINQVSVKVHGLDLEITLNEFTWKTKAVDGTFPDYNRVGPEWVKGDAEPPEKGRLSFSPKLLERVQRGFNWLRSDAVGIDMIVGDGTSPVTITPSSSAIPRVMAIIMPMHGDVNTCLERSRKAFTL